MTIISNILCKDTKNIKQIALFSKKKNYMPLKHNDIYILIISIFFRIFEIKLTTYDYL